MNGVTEPTLFELCGRNDARFSPYCWRTRYALAHKGLAARREPVRFTDKHRIAASGYDRVPVLRDGDEWIGDSWAIAVHLEDRFPGDTLFPGGRGLARLVNTWVDCELHPLILRAILGDIFEQIDPADREYFRRSREERLGGSIESFAARRDEFLGQLGPKLAPFETALGEAPFLSGENPAYPDFVLAGTFEWVARASTATLPEPGSRLADWFGRLRERYRRP